MTFLALESLSKTYGTVTVLESVDLSIERGEFVSLLGPSGCGKSTTLLMVAGLVDPTAGRITLDGQDITRLAPNRRGLGIVFQSYALFPHMTVAKNVSFGLEMRNVGRAERDRRVAEALALVRLSSMADRYPRQLSGGQRQRVAIARALVNRPAILLADEPTGNLDSRTGAEILGLFDELSRGGDTIIVVTHEEDVARHARRILRIRDGCIAADEPNHGRPLPPEPPVITHEVAG